MLSNKKNLLVFGLSVLTAGAMMVGCSTVKAELPTSEYNQKILDIDGIKNNTMGQIYDALVSEGDSNSEKVLNNILVLYSKSVFGDFLSELKPAIDSADITKLQAIADKYEIYHAEDGKGSTDKLKSIYNNFLYRIYKTFYSYVTNTTYQEESQFVEKKFYDAQWKNDPSSLGKKRETIVETKKQIYGFRHLDDVDMAENASIIDAYFEDIWGTYGKDDEGKTENSYIEIAVLPDIYRDELVCEYLVRENYRTLGISYGRKVNYIKLADNSKTEYKAATKQLVAQYAMQVIEANKLDKYPFSVLDSMIKGTIFYEDPSYESDPLITKIYTDADWHLFSDSDFTNSKSWSTAETGKYSKKIYKESTFGGYVADYLKINKTDEDNDSIVKDFTNSNAYPYQYGLALKYKELLTKDNTVSGWYTSTGLTDLPSDIKNRVFNMGVSEEVDSLNKKGTAKEDGSYVWYRNGATDNTGDSHYLITPKTYETGNEIPYVIGDSSNWYLVDVKEAVKSSKLSTTDKENYYDALKNQPYFGDYVARSIAATLSSSDTYKKSSNQYFVKKMALVYHDQSVYDYFKKTFPDLF